MSTEHPITEWQRTRCPRLLDRLVREHIGLVRLWVHRARPRHEAEAADFEQEGVLGLMRAMETFDPERGKLSTYASPHIRARLIRARYHGRRMVRPRSQAAYAGPSPLAFDASLDAPLTEDGSTLADLLPADETDTDPIATRRIRAALDSLPDRERHVVVAAVLEERPLREVGEAMGISGEGARQLLAKAIKRMRRALG